jgi:hypothetical protein
MPADAYVAKSLKMGDTTFDLRDDTLRPKWAIAPKVDAAADRAWGLVVAKVRVVAQDRAVADAIGNSFHMWCRRRYCRDRSVKAGL